MSSIPVIENIAEDIKTSINAITLQDGYNFVYKAIRPKRSDFTNETWDDLTVIVSQVEADELASSSGTKMWRQFFTLTAIVVDSETATTSIDTRLNQVAGDIIKKLLADPRRSTLALDTNVHSAVPFAVDKLSGIIIQISVDYRTKEDDPYTKA